MPAIGKYKSALTHQALVERGGREAPRLRVPRRFPARTGARRCPRAAATPGGAHHNDGAKGSTSPAGGRPGGCAGRA